jgi:hypothetical protein
MEFTPPMRALLTGLSKQSNTPITLQTQPPGIPSSSYINQSVDSGPSPMIDNPAPEDQSMNTSTPQSTPSFFPNVTYQPTLMHEQPQIQSQPMPETKPIEQKPEQPQPPESSERFYLEKVQQELRELKEKAHNLIIRLKSLCSDKSKITQKEISSLELSIRAIINEYTTLTSHIIYIRDLTGLDNDVQKQIKEFKTESAGLLTQLKGRANRNSLTRKIRKFFN